MCVWPSCRLGGFPSHIIRNNIFKILTFGAGWLYEQKKGGGGGLRKKELGRGEVVKKMVCAGVCLCMCVCVCVWRGGGLGIGS